MSDTHDQTAPWLTSCHIATTENTDAVLHACRSLGCDCDPDIKWLGKRWNVAHDSWCRLNQRAHASNT